MSDNSTVYFRPIWLLILQPVLMVGLRSLLIGIYVCIDKWKHHNNYVEPPDLEMNLQYIRIPHGVDRIIQDYVGEPYVTERDYGHDVFITFEEEKHHPDPNDIDIILNNDPGKKLLVPFARARYTHIFIQFMIMVIVTIQFVEQSIKQFNDTQLSKSDQALLFFYRLCNVSVYGQYVCGYMLFINFIAKYIGNCSLCYQIGLIEIHIVILTIFLVPFGLLYVFSAFCILFYLPVAMIAMIIVAIVIGSICGLISCWYSRYYRNSILVAKLLWHTGRELGLLYAFNCLLLFGCVVFRMSFKNLGYWTSWQSDMIDRINSDSSNLIAIWNILNCL